MKSDLSPWTHPNLVAHCSFRVWDLFGKDQHGDVTVLGLSAVFLYLKGSIRGDRLRHLRESLTLAILGALVLVPKRFWRRQFVLLALLVLPFWSAFSVIYFLPRYLIPVLPCLCIAAAAALVALSERCKVVPPSSP